MSEYKARITVEVREIETNKTIDKIADITYYSGEHQADCNTVLRKVLKIGLSDLSQFKTER